MTEKVCHVCGTSESDFLNTYMLGCPACYEVFDKKVHEFLLNIGQGEVHKGKTVKLSVIDRELLEEYHALFLEREKAVIEGDFSKTPEISKAIQELMEELKSRGVL
jgi:protein-arginine kinase activator protein McsA